MRGKLRGIGQEKNTTNHTSPGMKGVLLMNEEGLNSSGEIADAGTGNGCAGIPGVPQVISGRGGDAENPGRNQGELRSWEEAL